MIKLIREIFSSPNGTRLFQGKLYPSIIKLEAVLWIQTILMRIRLFNFQILDSLLKILNLHPFQQDTPVLFFVKITSAKRIRKMRIHISDTGTQHGRGGGPAPGVKCGLGSVGTAAGCGSGPFSAGSGSSKAEF